VALETSAIAVDRFLAKPNNTAFEVTSNFRNNAFIEHFQKAEAKSQPIPAHLNQLAPAVKPNFTVTKMVPPVSSQKMETGLPVTKTVKIAPKSEAVKEPARWVEYSVSKGDSLAGIAGMTSVSAEAIRQANGLDEKAVLKAGQKLRLPLDAPKMVYTVKSGDSLSRVASRFGIPLQDVIRANKMKQDNLAVGQKLELPLRVQGKALEMVNSSTVITPKLEKISSPEAGKKLVMVKSGELQMVANPLPKPALALVANESAKPAPAKPVMPTVVATTLPSASARAALSKAAELPKPVVAAPKILPTPAPLQVQPPAKPTITIAAAPALIPTPVKPTIVTVQPAPDADLQMVAHTVQNGENISVLARQYKTSIEAILNANKKAKASLKSGEQLQIPVSKKMYRVLQVTSKRAEVSTRLSMPVQGKLTDGYGWRNHPVYKRRLFHSGIDIAAPRGTAITAAQSGTVIFAGWLQGYGRLVVIKHPNGYSTRYGHCSSVRVSRGQNVRKGQVIGGVGATGTATGNHLHFEVRRNGKLLNPLPVLGMR
jgi:murein DD-endopeptidase MepM/ murein hydrolase activator NlpD